MNKMRISIQESCKFACATPQSKNFIGGENIINGGHLLNYGKVNEDNNDVVQIIAFCLQTLAKHVCGRHSPMLENNNTISISFEKITNIINNQDTSELLKSLSILEVECPKRCCEEVLCRFLRDPYTICIESMELYSVWLSERHFRITASNAYSLFTA